MFAFCNLFSNVILLPSIQENTSNDLKIKIKTKQRTGNSHERKKRKKTEAFLPFAGNRLKLITNDKQKKKQKRKKERKNRKRFWIIITK